MNERIKQLRINKNMTQTALGDVMGIGQKAVSLIEKGINKPTVSQIEVLSEFFGVSTDYIIKGVEFGYTQPDRELLNAVKEDASLYGSITAIMQAKKNIMSKTLQAA
jgi:transcriptional regulator with XRE-family HTH domain